MTNPNRERTFFLVAGEASGDLHGANLIRAMQNQDSPSRFIGHGGDRMAGEGMEIIEHIKNLSFMGFVEVIKHLPFMLRVMQQTISKIKELKPDRVILIDYPGFNLRLAINCSGLNIPVTYFIVPQLWAWKEGRIKTFRNHIDQSLCIFPFEQEWFESRGVPANFVGHPFSELNGADTSRDTFMKKHDLDGNAPIITLLPGSRQQEIDRHWPVFLETLELLRKANPNLQSVVGQAPFITLDPVPEFISRETEDVRAAMAYGTAALTVSGTASLECAVLDTPEVVCYKLAPLSGIIAKMVNKAPFVSMVNLIAEREVVPEFLQKNMTPRNLARAIQPLITSTAERKFMLAGFAEVRRTLGIPGVYERAAEAILMRTN